MSDTTARWRPYCDMIGTTIGWQTFKFPLGAGGQIEPGVAKNFRIFKYHNSRCDESLCMKFGGLLDIGHRFSLSQQNQESSPKNV